MNYEIIGVLIKKFDEYMITSTFTKKEFVIETRKEIGEKVFTENIKFQLVNDKCKLIDSFTEGEPIKVHFNIKGKKWEKDGKTSYFINLEAWKIEDEGQIGTSVDEKINIDNIQPELEDDQDLPF